MRAESPPLSDLTARARIIQAATAVFAEVGGSASIRTIAAAAGVSPALITHHFGTKEALKAECDQRVLDAYTAMKMAGIANPAASVALVNGADPAEAERLSVMSAYMLRAFLDGGEVAREFYRRLVVQMSEIMSAAAARGMIRPDCADEAHLAYLAASTLGFMLVRFVVDPPATPLGFGEHLMGEPVLMDAMIDVMTHGVFADDTVLTAFRAATDGRSAATNQKEDHV